MIRLERLPRRHLVAGALLMGTLLAACDGGSLDRDPDEGEVLVLEGATVFTSATSAPIDDGVVVILDGMIEAVGPRGSVPIPAAARRVAVSGLSLIPGLWNGDVGLPDPLLALADTASDEVLEEALLERFGRFGFTTIVETSRGRDELERLLERLTGPTAGGAAEGETASGVRGPRIIAVGPGLPTGFARPVAGGFAADPAGEVDPGLRAADLAERGFALIPGFTRAAYPGESDTPAAAEARVGAVIEEVAAFRGPGGELVFGSGSGYVPLYDPTSEYLYLEDAGASPEEILSALTMNPAIRFGHDYTGFIEPGMAADLVLIEGDPLADPMSLTDVLWVMRDGVVLFNRLDR